MQIGARSLAGRFAPFALSFISVVPHFPLPHRERVRHRGDVGCRQISATPLPPQSHKLSQVPCGAFSLTRKKECVLPGPLFGADSPLCERSAHDRASSFPATALQDDVPRQERQTGQHHSTNFLLLLLVLYSSLSGKREQRERARPRANEQQRAISARSSNAGRLVVVVAAVGEERCARGLNALDDLVAGGGGMRGLHTYRPRRGGGANGLFKWPNTPYSHS